MKFDLSIVSGTYNRLNSLQNMVQSVRNSVSYIDYEIVLVDGGSTDTTQDWCRQQKDIRLIEHGELKGAIKAFNDGAYASNSDYVILGNDDITFIGKSIWLSWLYMQQNEDCGIGCFYQDRERQHLPNHDKNKWWVGTMPVVRKGVQRWEPYGQVCIVPKWLGDYVGWWLREEDYMSRNLRIPKTYGGDNELSAKIYELGFKVSPIPDAKIHDNEIKDQLRIINNQGQMTDPKKTRGHHPDSWAWGKRWKRSNLVGPVVREYPTMENLVEKKQRILYLPIYEPGWEIQKTQKRGLREALEKKGPVAEYDYMNRFQQVGKENLMAELKKIIYDFIPTLVISQLHNADILNGLDVELLKKIMVDVLWVNWNGDFWPDNLLGAENMRLSRIFDYQFIINREVLEKYVREGINANYWQIGWEPDSIGYEPEEFHDVVFLASGYSKVRKKTVDMIRGMNCSFGLYGPGWPKGYSKGNTIYNFEAGCKIYRGAKIGIGDSLWPKSGFVSNRLFQALVAGNCAIFYQWFDRYEELGLVDGENIVIWKDNDDLKNKIEYYLTHENERKKIADAGEQLALTRHSFDVRVEELFSFIESDLEGDLDWR